jgi:hypothetical protein
MNGKSTNYPHGIQIDLDGRGGMADERFVPGSRSEAGTGAFAAAALPGVFWVAPAPCKVISAVERHGVVAGQAGTMQVEKVPSGTAPGSGTVVLATAFDGTTTINTNVSSAALATSAATLAKGDALALKVASGALTSLAGACVVVTVEYL